MVFRRTPTGPHVQFGKSTQVASWKTDVDSGDVRPAGRLSQGWAAGDAAQWLESPG